MSNVAALAGAGRFAVLILAAACAPGPQLPTSPRLPDGVQVMCEAALLEGTLRGDAQDPRVTWLIAPTGVRRELQWPFGFSARFAPDLQVISYDGQVVAREGDDVDLGGGFRPDTEVFAVCEINGVMYIGG